MKNQDYREKLFDLLHGDLSQEEKDTIIADLMKSGLKREEIDSMSSVDHLLDEMTVTEPSGKMDKRFYAMLEEEQRRLLLGEPEIEGRHRASVLFSRAALRTAAGIALFILGWFSSGWLGTSLSGHKQVANLANEVKQLKETLVLTMMQQSSSVERIKAVNMAGQFDSADVQIIESLTDLLNNDGNDNVRLLALDALAKYASLPEVRENLIESIGTQTSPMVQLRFAEIMLALNEKRAVPEFQKILRNTNLNYNVRGKMNEALVVLL